MAESRWDKFKYGLLKVIDVSGFKVFDPVVRLLFGEEPKKQAGEILKFIVTPAVFIFCCLALWSIVAPRHKTKSGEVPTPAVVLNAAAVNQTLHDRENEKDSDFLAQGSDRELAIEEVAALLKVKEQEAEVLKQKLAEIRIAAEKQTAELIAPLELRESELQQSNGEAQAKRRAEAVSISEDIAAGKATTQELLEFLRADNALKDVEKEAEKAIKDEIRERSEPSQEVKLAEMASDAVANEVQHLIKRLDYLQSGNRDSKVEQASVATTAAIENLSKATTPSAILAAAKSVVSAEERAQKTSEQSYPRRSTVWLQVQRSLFTVFVGFVMAAVIAIPIGIMCGLNKVVMACLTPIISVFKPVSPVVWLLIFQIVVGAFFLPDPESYWLFEVCDSLPWIRDLGVNPALVFSACTVMMCAVWPAMVNTALGVSSIDQDHLNVARVLKLGLWSRLFKIIIPSSLPLVFAGLRISLGVGWMVLIAAEALSSSEGLGKFVWDEYQNGSSHSFANIIFACFLVGIIGFVLDRIMIVLQRGVSFDDVAAAV
ncbi:MAG: ABC transporter permease subunit [Planctomycetaceae bacterium]|nr:ABC transporter permease subunit [Planctomycetaceae bacterium]